VANSSVDQSKKSNGWSTIACATRRSLADSDPVMERIRSMTYELATYSVLAAASSLFFVTDSISYVASCRLDRIFTSDRGTCLTGSLLHVAG